MLQDDSDRILVPFWRVALHFLRLGAVGFGGPIALVGVMHQDLVAGFSGMLAATTGVFLPVYLFVIIAAPIRRVSGG